MELTTNRLSLPNLSPQFARLNDLRIAYREGGTGSEPLILIHGLCSMMYTWKDVFAPLAARHRVIALDLKGYGASDKPPGDYSFDEQARIVLRFMDALSIERAVVVGNSMGGSVALRIAALAPERITRMVLLSPVVHPTHHSTWITRLALGWNGGLGRGIASQIFRVLVTVPGFLRWRMTRVYDSRKVITAERLGAYHGLLRDPACQRAIIATLQDWDLHSVTRGLRHAPQPALVIWGDRDRVVGPAFADALIRDLPQAQLKLLPCGHAPQEEMPREVAQLINDFLS